MKKPEKWTDVYPQGTKAGEEEYRFFKSLARNPKYEWRSTSGIAKEADLTKGRVEEIIKKYLKKGMVFQNAKNEDLWAYWARVKDLLLKDDKSISKKDQDKRIDKIISDIVIDQNQPFPGHREGYAVDERWSPPSGDEMAPWETNNYEGFDVDDSIKTPDSTTYPQIYGFKTPGPYKLITWSIVSEKVNH